MSDGAEEFGAEGYNLLLIVGTFVSGGIDVTELVGLVGSLSRPPLADRDSGLDEGTRRPGGVEDVSGFGFERLLARLKMSFAAEATVHPPPVVEGAPLARTAPDIGRTPGPPGPTTAAGSPRACDAIVFNYLVRAPL